jgi:hypothetical protein
MAKKWLGTFSIIDDDFDLFAALEFMDDVVLTSDRVAMDWHDDSDHYSVVLHPVNRKGYVCWYGKILLVNNNSIVGEISAVRYDLKGGGAILLCQWEQNGGGGNGVFEILPADSVYE